MPMVFDDEFYKNLPRDFHWGAATAAYQIEGAVVEDGRGQCIWDAFSHTPGKTERGDTGDVACDHYHRYREDLRLMKDLGIRNYRFSISWPRIFPLGEGAPNPKGIDFYDRLIDLLLDLGIEPMATLYHWDLPLALQEKGGWQNRDTALRFQEYAALAFDRFGDRVARWVTHNEPWCTAVLGHYTGEHAPGLRDIRAARTVAHHTLLSHGLAVEAFRRSGRPGEIGVTLNLTPADPGSDREEDRNAAARMDAFSNRWFLDPIFRGSYPPELDEAFGTLHGVILEGDFKTVSTSVDFLGVNYYSANTVVDDAQGGELKVRHVPLYGRVTDMGWAVRPEGLTDLLVRLSRDYAAPPIYITENGAAYADELQIRDGTAAVNDRERIEFVADHLKAVVTARQRGVDVRGYYLWSFMDNFEWAYGYTKRFGLVYVDYATQRRIPKDSALWYRDVADGFRRSRSSAP